MEFEVSQQKPVTRTFLELPFNSWYINPYNVLCFKIDDNTFLNCSQEKVSKKPIRSGNCYPVKVDKMIYSYQ